MHKDGWEHTTKPMLELKGIVKQYGDTKVVDGLDLCVAQGEIVCLLGPSGCGKTTTLRMVGGFIKPDSGQIIIDGKDVRDLGPEARPVSTVFQSYALFPHMTVLENVSYGLKYMRDDQGKKLTRNQKQELAMKMLAKVGMDTFASSRVTQISGGQQQRVALARSLVLNPKVLLLDEPLSNLDAGLRLHMRGELKQIQRELQTTMLFVTHDREEALILGDRIAIMEGGRLHQTGKPQEVYSHPADEFCARFLGTVNAVQSSQGTVFFRAEDARLVGVSGSDSQENKASLRFEGTIAQVSYLGSHYRYTLDTGRETVVIDGSKDDLYTLGDRVFFDIKHILAW